MNGEPASTIVCPYCKTKTHFTERARWPAVRRGGVYFASWACDACEGPVVGEMDTATGGPLRHQPVDVPEPNFPDVPESIASDAVEAHQCFAVGAYRATAAMARRAIQASALDKGAPDKKLQEQIDWLAGEGIVTVQMKDVAHAIRVGGNEGTHPGKDGLNDVDREQAERYLAFLDDFLRFVYVIPADLDRLQGKDQE